MLKYLICCVLFLYLCVSPIHLLFHQYKLMFMLKKISLLIPQKSIKHKNADFKQRLECAAPKTVVYFDQDLGAVHSKHWLKSSFSTFFFLKGQKNAKK